MGAGGGSVRIRREHRAEATSGYNVDEEVARLVAICERLCDGPSGELTFKEIFYDEECEGQFESLIGTMKAAKKRGIIAFDPPLLLQGVHDEERIVFHGRQ